MKNISTIPNDNPLPLFLQVDAGNATGKGFEATFSAQISPELSIFGNYAYIDATFDDEDENGNPQVFAGNRFRLTPENSFAIGIDYTLEYSDSLTFYVTPSYSWKSEINFEDDNDPALTQDGYGLLNLKAGIYWGEGSSWDASLYISNVMDEKYIIDAGNTGNTFGIPTYVAGPPMFWGIRLSKTF